MQINFNSLTPADKLLKIIFSDKFQGVYGVPGFISQSYIIEKGLRLLCSVHFIFLSLVCPLWSGFASQEKYSLNKKKPALAGGFFHHVYVTPTYLRVSRRSEAELEEFLIIQSYLKTLFFLSRKYFYSFDICNKMPARCKCFRSCRTQIINRLFYNSFVIVEANTICIIRYPFQGFFSFLMRINSEQKWLIRFQKYLLQRLQPATLYYSSKCSNTLLNCK